MFLVSLILAAQPVPPPAEAPDHREEERSIQFKASGAQLLQLSSVALAKDDEKLANTILTKLLEDPDIRIRNEARFRLAMLAARRKEWNAAAGLLSRIIDDEPGAQRVRLELARVQAEMGNLDASRQTLRQAQAGELPPDVAQLVERFSSLLRARKPFGFSVQMAIAPDTNINRATRSPTLGTVIGDFQIGRKSREQSGVGMTVNSEVYYRHPLSQTVSLLGRAGVASDFYRKTAFNDVAVFASVGPEFALLSGRATVSLGGQQRWFGGEPYSNSLDANMQWQRALGKRGQFRAGVGFSGLNSRLNDLQDSRTLNGFVGYERALSTRAGASLTIGASRQAANDPAYSSTSGQATATAWRDVGRSTFFASATYSRFEADKRLSIYPERRKEDFIRLSTGATLRALEWRGWAPQLKIVHERNKSPIEVYRYHRWRGEFGFARAF